MNLLIVPGLHDSGPAHWQSWLQSLHRGALRAQQRDWSDPQLERWADRVGCHWVNLGDAGHINAESGFGPLPFAHRWVLQMERLRSPFAFCA